MEKLIHDGSNIQCPLCGNRDISQSLTSAIDLNYWLCAQCKLIFADRSELPEPDAEKERYLTHQNGIQYPGYVKFLNQAVKPTLQFLKPGMRGLDYGCGHTPTLSILLRRKGFYCDVYDPLFYPDLPDGLFDFVFVLEVAEHFFHPREEIIKLDNLLHPGGMMTIMTLFWIDAKRFSDWYYPKDFTHVSFYHTQTMQSICELFGFKQIYSDNERIAILKKSLDFG